jgi:hypothetical protein
MIDYSTVAQTPFINITEIGNALNQAQAVKAQQIRNRLLFMEEQQRNEAQKAEIARREELLNMGLSMTQATAGARVAAPPPVANAFTGPPLPQNALPATGESLTTGGAATTAPGVVPAVPAAIPEGDLPPVAPPPVARQPYSPTAWGRYSAQEGMRTQALKEAKDTFSTLLKSAVDTGSQEMTDSLIRAAKKSPALASMISFLGDPDGPEEQRLRVVGKGEAETESAFSKEQLVELAKNAQNDTVRKAIEGAKPGTYAIKTKGSQVIGFKPSAGASKPLSDIGKLEHDRDLKIDGLIAAGKYKTREEAFGDPEVKAYQDEIKKKSEPKDAYPIGHVQAFQEGRNMVYKEYKGNQKWEVRKDLGGGPKDLPPQVADDFKLWDKETKTWHFENMKTTGVKPDFGWGKDAGRSRAQFQREYAEWNLGKGVTGAEAGAQSAEYKAKAMSVRNQEKIRGMMGGFVRNMDKQIVRLDEIYAGLVSRVGLRALDLPKREIIKLAIGSGNETIVEAYLAEISREIGKLSTGSAASIQELSVQAQAKWDKIHDPNLSPREIKKILTETRHMGQMRLDSSDEEIKKTLDDMRNMGKGPGSEGKGTEKAVEPRKPGESIADYLRRTKR